jgi:hypothetical protein
MTTPLEKLNLLDSKSLEDVRLFGVLHYPITPAYESDYLTKDDITYADRWPGEHFTYKINEYGFRSGAMPSEIDLAAFGCSFTFGAGLPETALWHSLLGKKLNMSTANFGLAGRSIATCVDVFLILSKHIKMKNAVFLLPSIDRLQIAKKHPDHDLVYHLATMLDFKSDVNLKFGLDTKQLYRALPEEEIQKICKNQIYLLDYVAKARGINVYISSWENHTYDFLCKLDLQSIKILPIWQAPSIEFAISDKARDMLHPGPKHHKKWFNKIKDIVK